MASLDCQWPLREVPVPLAWADRWIRLDARGNKEGVDAHFSLNGEHLAWPMDPSQGEIDYPVVDASPPPPSCQRWPPPALAAARPGVAGCDGLPTEL